MILTFDEFEAVQEAYRERDDTMQPHCKHRLHPRKVLPFEWEKARRPGHVNSAPELSKAVAKEAFLRRIGK